MRHEQPVLPAEEMRRAITAAERQQRGEEDRLRVRVALGVKILTTAGYAMIGGTFFRAVAEQRAVPPLSIFWVIAGLACLGAALFFAPRGVNADD